MRLSLALQILLTNAVATNAFLSTPPCTPSTKLFSDSRLKNPEWDNDDFLNSLSGTPEQRQDANRRYHEQSEKTRESQARMAEWRQANEGRNSNPTIPKPPMSQMGLLEDQQLVDGMAQPGDISGGSRFRNMLEQAGSRQSPVKPYPEQFHDPSEFTNNPYQQQYQPPPQQYQQPPPQQPISDPNELLNQLAGQAQPQYQQQPPVMKDPGRPVGRNKDADQIANSSDMYFAQLKLDSKIRKRAFLSGDYETSNKVFEDERVQNLPSELEKNPFIRAVTEQSKRNQDVDLSTSEDEALPTPTIMYTAAELNKPKYTPGLNYRERLKARQQGTSLPSNTVVTSAPKEVYTPDVSNIQESVIEEPPVVEETFIEEQEVVSTPPQQQYHQPPPQQTPPQPVQPVYQQPEPVQYQPPPQAQQPIQYSNDPYEMLNQLAGEVSPQQPQPGQLDPNRPVGRNKDADQIANTSDMYFAQLKLDSKLRKRAFLSGDYESSNKVFEDERVQNLPTELQKNPFIRAVTDQSKRNNELSTSEDEALTTMMFTNAEINKPSKAAGLNYRDKLKAKQQNQVVDAQPAASVEPAVTEPVASTPPPVVQQSISDSSTVMGDDYANESRGKMRLLQGLILKHKGGPGFGAGRLKAPEEQRFKETAKDVLSMLKSEVASSPREQMATATFNTASTPTTSTPVAPPAVDTNPLQSAQVALQEAMQKCQDPSLSDEEKAKILLSAQVALQEAAAKLAGGAKVAHEAPKEVVPSTPQETNEIFSSKNDDLLKDILIKLKDASGDAKFGLKQSLEKEKAEELMELLPQMRQALLEELEMAPSVQPVSNEVKGPKKNPNAATFDHSNPSGGSKYQEMLARAKAAKAAQS